jgi:hypothetical protein
VSINDSRYSSLFVLLYHNIIFQGLIPLLSSNGRSRLWLSSAGPGFHLNEAVLQGSSMPLYAVFLPVAAILHYQDIMLSLHLISSPNTTFLHSSFMHLPMSSYLAPPVSHDLIFRSKMGYRSQRIYIMALFLLVFLGTLQPKVPVTWHSI